MELKHIQDTILQAGDGEAILSDEQREQLDKIINKLDN